MAATLEAMQEQEEQEQEVVRNRHEGPVPPPPGLDRLVLTGFMGSGKTSVGRVLAQRLGWRFLDLDREIERREGRSVPAIFAESGEAAFRHAESATLVSLLGERHVVLALGGGTPEELGNRLVLEQTPHTCVVYLDAPLATLLDRCRAESATPGGVDRPLLAEAETRFHGRRRVYQRIARHTLETSALPVESVASAILELLDAAA
jgi:shikimate kinase